MIIRIVGSMVFYHQFEEAKKFLEDQGHQVILPDPNPVPEPIPKEMKLKFMEVFNEDLKKSDALLVMNYTKENNTHHIGTNTLMEIGMAFILKKKIFLLNPPPKHCQHELEAIGCQILNNNLNNFN